MAAFAIDLSILVRAGAQLQRTADAAALAGAAQLFATRDGATGRWGPPPDYRWDPSASPPVDEITSNMRAGWTRASQAVFAAINQNGFYHSRGALSQNDSSVTNANTTDTFYWFAASAGARQYWQYDFPAMRITIVRGIVETPTAAFISLEKGSGFVTSGTMTGTGTCNYDPSTQKVASCNVPAVMQGSDQKPCTGPDPEVNCIANAVRVTLTQKNIPTVFGRLFGFSSLSTLTRTGFGIRTA